ncbi:zinc finger protein 665 [Phlebotomus papatasi]|uniref:zinc finger protein 665 n=1 Tax=Phlebotomus papatasi TaxID=29031 RepID=UPI002483B9CB|nr:zinc finger protein 665 [Phlebotomus papatasi]
MSRRKTQHETLIDHDESSQICEEYQEDAQSDDVLDIKKNCHYCEKEFGTAKRRFLHERYCKAGDIERFSCKVCDLNFKFQLGLERHEKRHEPPGGFLCGVCNEKFTTDADRVQHRNQEHKVYRCQICEAKFGTEAEYVAHIVNQHGGKDREPVVCSDCGQQFRSSTQLKAHNESKCGTIKMYSCNECNSRFMTSTTLKAHKLIHLGVKKHLCNFCGSNFLSKGQLKVHERSHTGEKPFKCNECGKAFAYRESLVTHSSLHTGIRPYVCELCGSKFSCIGNLIKHRRSRPDTCGLPQFRRNSKVTPRMKTKKLRGNLTSKLEKLVERNEISIVHQLQLVDTNEEMPSVKKEKDEVEIFNIGAPHGSVAPKLEDFADTKPQVTEVLIHNAQEAEDLDDDLPLSTLRSQVVTKKEQKFILTEVEIVPKVTKEVPKRKAKEPKAPPKEVKERKVEKKPPKTPIKKSESDESNDIDFFDMNDLSKESDDDETYQPDPVKSEEDEDEDDDEEEEVEIVRKPKVRNERVSMVHEYKCDHCPKMFCYKTIFNLHLKREHNMDIKDEDLPNQQRYSKILFPRDRVHECQYCKRKYANKPALLKHEQLHGPEGKLHVKCRVCKEYFENNEKEKEHRLAKHKEEITCKVCQKVYRDESHLQVHFRNCHTKEPIKKLQHLCGKCGKSFTSKTAMLDHERSDCGKSPIYQCDVCKKFYHSAGSLKTHKNVHTNELPNLCKYCGKGFRTPGQLKVHERIHTGEKPFKCTYCPKAFGHRESLLTHVSLHTGFKRFMCSGCGQRFTCISNLQAHRKAHADTCGLVPNCTKAVGPMDIANPLKSERQDMDQA